MFERDFALAAMAHVRELKRIIERLAARSDGDYSARARELLAREGDHVGRDSRLDVRAWRDELWSFLVGVGIDPATAQPET